MRLRVAFCDDPAGAVAQAKQECNEATQHLVETIGDLLVEDWLSERSARLANRALTRVRSAGNTRTPDPESEAAA